MQIELNLGFPQVAVVCLYLLNVIYAGAHHGEETSRTENVWITVAAAAVMMLLLWAGGFFS